jgi:hypothetical protein
LLGRCVMETDEHAFPVLEHGQLVGLVRGEDSMG